MNYRHAFHAGGFADVHKHAVLARIVMHLREKPAAFRILDTHAGAGLYDLSGPEAARTGEWRGGIDRLLAQPLDPALGQMLAPYLATLAHFNPNATLKIYPGSPALARALLRPQDRLIACESEEDAARALADTLGRDRRAKSIAIDGWTALAAYVPPKERRGLVLIDPPFEQPDEFARLGDEVAKAHRKWPTGIYMLWYPIKDRAGPERLAGHFKRAGIGKILRSELLIGTPGDPQRLNGSGLVLINPPWRLADELAQLMPAMAAVLGRDGAGRARLDWLSGDQ
jgi:23S rRNA (adenine2030-N6)-methyltransferase